MKKKQRALVRFALAAADDTGRFSGIASVFGNLIDTYPPTKIAKGAFAKTLSDQAALSRVRILYQHDVDRPIGVPISLRETARGLEIEAALGNSSLAQDVRALLQPLPAAGGRAVLDELSIGFDPVRWEMQADPTVEGGEIRVIHELDLWEVSVVTFGADSKAKITSAHARNPELAEVDAALAEAAIDMEVVRAQEQLEAEKRVALAHDPERLAAHLDETLLEGFALLPVPEVQVTAEDVADDEAADRVLASIEAAARARRDQ